MLVLQTYARKRSSLILLLFAGLRWRAVSAWSNQIAYMEGAGDDPVVDESFDAKFCFFQLIYCFVARSVV